MTKPIKISVVTAVYNVEEYINETMKSIHGQEYENLEHIVVDGLSTDNTLSIIKKYESTVAKIISEKDEGQYDAINKGFRHSTGEIMAWLNGDDVYYPWTFKIVNTIFQDYPEIDWIIGLPTFIDIRGCMIKSHKTPRFYPQDWIQKGFFCNSYLGCMQQESMFWRRSLWDKTSKNLNLGKAASFSADFQLWVEFSKFSEPVPLSFPISSFRIGDEGQRSVKNKRQYDEEVTEFNKNNPKPNLLHRFFLLFPILSKFLIPYSIYKTSPAIIYCYKTCRYIKVNFLRSFADGSPFNSIQMIIKSKIFLAKVFQRKAAKED